MATGPKRKKTGKTPGKTSRKKGGHTTSKRDLREAATASFLHSKTFRELKVLVALARNAASLAGSLADRIPALQKAGVFGYMLFPNTSTGEMIRDLVAMSFICRTVADTIESEMPAKAAKATGTANPADPK